MESRLNQQTLNIIRQFIDDEIGENIIYGVNYAFVLDNEKDESVKNSRYMKVKAECVKCGYDDELFSVVRVINGTIYRIDINAAITIITKQIKDYSSDSDDVKRDVIKWMEKSVVDNVATAGNRLLKYLIQRLRTGVKEVDICIMCKNINNKASIVIDDIMYRYNAYNIRIEDINKLSNALDKSAGYYIKTLNLQQILPSKKAVLVRIVMSKS